MGIQRVILSCLTASSLIVAGLAVPASAAPAPESPPPAPQQNTSTEEKASEEPASEPVQQQDTTAATSTMSLPPASGSNGKAAGSRAAAEMVERELSDTVDLGWNPTTGNIVLTGDLLSMPGSSDRDIALSWRYNSINDQRPTLSVGVTEAGLQVSSDNRITYTAADGGTYTFVPKSGGGWTMPPGLNASITSFTSSAITLRFNETGHTNWYQKSGSVYRLDQAGDHHSGPGDRIDYSYDSDGRITTIESATGRTISFEYESYNNSSQPTEITDHTLDRELDFEYDGYGRMVKVTDATGADTRFEYNSDGLIDNVRDGREGETAIGYDGAGKASQLTFGYDSYAPSTETFAYTSTTATRTDANDHDTRYKFNSARQVTTITDANGNVTTRSFDAHDNLLSTLDGLGNLTTATYNPNNTLAAITSPAGEPGGDGQEVTYTYPAATTADRWAEHQPIASTDTEGNTTTYAYDTNTRRLQVTTTPDGRGVTFENYYQGDDAGTTCAALAGQLCKSINGNGNTTRYGYDAERNVDTIDRPGPLGTIINTFDAAGRVTASTDGKGQTAHNSYDGNDRLNQVRYGSTCVPATCVSYNYDNNGNLTNRTDAAGTTTYAYDAQNRPTAKTIGGTTTELTYDPVSNVTSFTDPTGTVKYRYDAADRLISLAEPVGSCPATPTFPNTTGCTGFAYDDNNRRTATKYPNGVTNTTVYDNAGRITSITAKRSGGAVLTKRDYTYTVGANGQDGALAKTVTTETEQLSTYGYDKSLRLLSAKTGSTTESWRYDENNNRTIDRETGKPTVYSAYNASDQLCWSGSQTGSCANPPAGAAEYSYDANGNTTAAGPKTRTYNVFDQLATATTGNDTISLSYAGLSNTERTASGATNFLNGLLGITRQVTNGETTSFIRDPEGTLISMRNSDGRFYYTTDRLGSVLTLTNSGQNKAASYTYDAWGNATRTGNQATANPWQFAGGYHEAATDRVKFGARYYNPYRGRFGQVDPSFQEQNRYLYAQACPTNYTDPTGLDTIDCLLGLGGAIAGVAIFGGSVLTAPATLGGSLLIGGAALGSLVLSGQAARACGFI